MPHPLANHPIVVACGGAIALAGLSKAKYTRGFACVRQLESTSDGYVVVEMDDDRVFVADLESLQSLHGAHQSRTPVRYWINNFKRIYGVPRGNLGDISLVSRFSGK